MMRTILALILVAGGALTLPAQDIRVQSVLGDNRVAIGDVVLYALDVRVVMPSDAEVAPPSAAELPAVEGLTVLGSEVIDRGTSQRMSIINGRRSVKIEYHWQVVYRLRAGDVGGYTMPAFAYRYLDRDHAVRALRFEVVKEAPGNQFVTLAVSASDVSPFANEAVTLRFVLTFTKPFDPNEVPEIEIPWATSAQGFSGEAPPPGWTKGRGVRVRLNDETYDLLRETGRGEVVETLSFTRTIYPLAPGRLELGTASARLYVATRTRRGVFRTEVVANEKAVLTSSPLVIDVRDAPKADRPASFSGIIGNFDGELELGETRVRAGNGVTLTLRLRGEGGLATVPPPVLRGLDEFDVYDPDRRIVGEEDEKMLEIGWLLVPKSGRTPKEIPKVDVSWFRPRDERFVTVSVGPAPLEITGEVEDSEIFGGVAAARSARRSLALGEGLRPMKSEPGAIVADRRRGPSVVLIAAIALLPLLSLLATSFLVGRRRRAAGDVAGQRRSRASKEAKARLAEVQGLLEAERGFHNQLTRALQGFVGDKLDLPAGRITAATAADIVGQATGANDLGTRLAVFLGDLEAKEFGGAGGDRSVRRADLAAAEELIRDLDRELGR